MQRRSRKARPKPPLEYSILYTATLCLIAAGAVMVYSASSASSLLGSIGDPAYYLKRYVLYAVLGLVAMHMASRRGIPLARRLTPLLVGLGFVLTVAVMVPGIGVTVNGATRWLSAGPVQFQPSELLKIALVLYGAQLLATRPKRVRTLRGLSRPLLVVVGAACLLLLVQPDMGTALVICFSTFCLMLAGGARLRHLGILLGVLAGLALIVAIAEPYRRARLMSFMDPWKDSSGAGFQAAQAQIAIGSGGFFGRGLGESIQKIFYLPEAHTDMILAVVGEELGVIGVSMLAALYGMIGYAGFRAAKLAKDRYAKLLAAGITALILVQAVLNFFAVMGMAPLTGVPLPFVSYGNSNLIVLLGAMGLLLGVAATGGERAGRLRAVEGGRERDDVAGRSPSGLADYPGASIPSGRSAAARAHSGGRHGGARRAGARDRRRAAR
jgi:cell division protein FtsW